MQCSSPPTPMCATGLNFAPPFENKLRQAERKRESEID